MFVFVLQKRIDDAKTRLTQVTRENTRRLDTFTVLLEEKKRLERQLDSRQKNLVIFDFLLDIFPQKLLGLLALQYWLGLYRDCPAIHAYKGTTLL